MKCSETFAAVVFWTGLMIYLAVVLGLCCDFDWNQLMAMLGVK